MPARFSQSSTGRLRAWAAVPVLVAPCLLLAGAAPRPQAGSVAYSLSVGFALQAPLQAPLSGTIHLRPLARQGEPLAISIAGSAAVTLHPRLDGPWELTAQIPGFWAQPETVYFTPTHREVERRLQLWPAAKVAGSVRLAKAGEKAPSEILLQVESPESRDPGPRIRRSTVTCPVSETGAFACEAPATTLDLVLRADGFVPHYRWALGVQPGKLSDLGTLELQQGASLAGWVQPADGPVLAGRCTATLAPATAPGYGGREQDRQISAAAVPVPVAENGFFQFRGVAPGSYLVTAVQPGFVSAVVRDLEVWKGSETLLKAPLVLSRPLTLGFTLVPPVDWLGRPWQLELWRLSELTGQGGRAPVFEGSTGPEGRAVIHDQAAGKFTVKVADSLGNRLYFDRGLAITGPENAEQRIDLEVVHLSGTVHFGGEPLAARVWLGGRFGVERTELESNADGEIEGVVPRTGLWSFEVESTDPELVTEGTVEVVETEPGEARVAIEVPDTLVFGRVLDEGGKAVRGATVLAAVDPIGSSVFSDAEGRFEFRGLPEGLVSLAAENHTAPGVPWSSETQVIPLADGDRRGPIELKLRRTREVSGRVESPRGPVAGATVRLQPVDRGWGYSGETKSDLAGEWKTRVEGEARRLVAWVLPPGGALKAFEMARPEGPVVLHVPTEGGDLELVWSPQLDAADPGKPLLFQNSAYLPYPLLRQWAEGHGVFWPREPVEGGDVVMPVPRLAPGDYLACHAPTPPLHLTDLLSWATQRGRCSSGYLEVGGALRLTISAAERQADGGDRP